MQKDPVSSSISADALQSQMAQTGAVQEGLMQQGVDLMLYGMGTVAVFLTLLVVATVIMSSFIQRFFPQEEVDIPSPGATTAPAGINDPKLLAIIKAAIDQHRSKK